VVGRVKRIKLCWLIAIILVIGSHVVKVYQTDIIDIKITSETLWNLKLSVSSFEYIAVAAVSSFKLLFT